MLDLTTYFLTLSGLATASMFVTGWLNTNLFKIMNSTGKQIVSWVVAILISFVGMWKGLGLFAQADVVTTIITGVAVGLISNGIFDLKFVQALLELVKAKPASVK
jgi:hypothetical protein